jgi:hypothetical protein
MKRQPSSAATPSTLERSSGWECTASTIMAVQGPLTVTAVTWASSSFASVSPAFWASSDPSVAIVLEH